MNTITIIFIITVFLAIVLGIFRFMKTKSQNQKLNQQRFERILPLYKKLESGEALSQEEVYAFAKNIQTRQSCYQLLSEHNKTELFPREFHTIEKAAETTLANWLEFPTELDAIPDEMRHIKRVTIDFDGQKNYVHYEVFKCRVNEPHWAAKNGWFLGVVGPYFDDSKPYDFPRATFSRISSSADKVTPEEEAKWVHENISFKR